MQEIQTKKKKQTNDPQNLQNLYFLLARSKWAPTGDLKVNRKALKWIISIQHQDFYHLIDVTNHNLTENAPIVTVLFLRGNKRFPIKTSYI